jgi:hypothetical protein
MRENEVNRMKRLLVLLPLISVILYGCAEIRLPARLPLPRVGQPMETAAFWINRLPEPDRLLMTEAEIADFNARNTRPDIYVTDILDYPGTVSGKEIEEMVAPLIDWARRHVRYGHDNFPVADGFFPDTQRDIGLPSVPGGLAVRFGMTAVEADLRVLPTTEIGMGVEGDYEFDELQVSLLSPGTPVAVVWETPDGRWYFVVTPYASGWVEARAVGIARSKDEIGRYLHARPFIVVTEPEVEVYADRELSRHAGRLRLGCRTPLVGKTNDALVVLVPTRSLDGRLVFRRGFVPAGGAVHEGYLPYTKRNCMTVAFAMEGRRYGWGGMYGYWDCSSYVRDVFSVFGIVLPRNSGSQAKIGVPLGRFEAGIPDADKDTVLDKARPGATLLVLPGHVMIYLGEYGGRYYAIHDLWAYRTRDDLGRRELMGVGRVVVSELSLGRGGMRGPLIERITDIVEVR